MYHEERYKWKYYCNKPPEVVSKRVKKNTKAKNDTLKYIFCVDENEDEYIYDIIDT